MTESKQHRATGSRWWYGIAFFVLSLTLVWVSYLVLQTVSGPQTPSSTALVPSDPRVGGIFLASAVLSALFVLITSLLAPLYSLCLYLDVRSLQGSEEWSPNRAVWGLVSLVHLLSFVFSPVQLVTIPAGGAYLYLRNRSVGLRS
ncbi:hypothetical protein SAMN04487949_3593 [Halogranum gelatinilyticum]|uniref:Uncharacterized protein n=1 Tax=Halogranum gelatinilyticum TaxID=660521 RepID=A0A1G9ZBM5_9EURY|nr:hypothetical protein SAMN04487949_3593 [Halogranum gelatinilyticum]